MPSKVALVIGVSYKTGGASIGRTTALSLLSAGYKVAVVGRSLNPEAAAKEGFFGVTADVDNHRNIQSVFKEVTEKLGAPSVLVYNAGLGGPVLSFFAATQAFIAGNKALDGPKMVLYVGDIFNEQIIPGYLTLGLGKTGGAYLVQSGAANPELQEEKDRFYYLDQRSPEGHPAYPPSLSGKAHASVVLKLMAEEKQNDPSMHLVLHLDEARNG
ncbi:hypothetical protein P7C73_g2511, partial [Tremellales sp. Uapishka_1]